MLQATIIGYIGQDAVIKEVNGKTVTNFSVAHSERFKTQAGVVKESTTWVECNMWDAENVTAYLKKGVLVAAVGQPEANAWIDKNHNAAANIRLRVSKLELLSSGKKNESNNESLNADENVGKPVDPRAEALSAVNTE